MADKVGIAAVLNASSIANTGTQIQMDGPPPEPDWPAGITVHTITAADWPAVGAALEEAFHDHWGQIDPAWLESASASDDADTAGEEDEVDDYEKEIRPGQDWVMRNPTLK